VARAWAGWACSFGASPWIVRKFNLGFASNAAVCRLLLAVGAAAMKGVADVATPIPPASTPTGPVVPPVRAAALALASACRVAAGGLLRREGRPLEPVTLGRVLTLPASVRAVTAPAPTLGDPVCVAIGTPQPRLAWRSLPPPPGRGAIVDLVAALADTSADDAAADAMRGALVAATVRWLLRETARQNGAGAVGRARRPTPPTQPTSPPTNPVAPSITTTDSLTRPSGAVSSPSRPAGTPTRRPALA